MTKSLPIGLVQTKAVGRGDLQAFSVRLAELVRSSPQTKLWVFPEYHLFPMDWTSPDLPRQINEHAEPIAGERGAALAGMARQHGVWLVPGTVLERAEDGQIYNTAVVYNPDGELVASYRKVFPWRPVETVSCGSEFVVFELESFGTVGLSICYDAWFPECSRHLAWLGADVILNMVQTGSTDRQQEMVLCRANAIVNQVFVASVNAAAPNGLGRSMIVDPEGHEISLPLTSEEAVILQTLDLARVSTVREFGTAGVTTPWKQFHDSSDALMLPLYQGGVSALNWKPASSMGVEK